MAGLDTIAATYADAGPDTRRRKAVARTFEADDEAERLLRMREEEPERFAGLSVTTRMAVGSYESAKTAAEQFPEVQS